MRFYLLLVLLAAQLLCSCQGPTVTVLRDELRPGELKGRTLAIGGMEPGAPIAPKILLPAEAALWRSLKGSQVQALPADLIFQASKAVERAGWITTSADLDSLAAGFSRSHADLADYFFMIFLRMDSVEHIKNGGEKTDYIVITAPVRGSSWGSRYSWHGITRHTLKADYLLCDNHTHKVVWKARAIYSDEGVSINSAGIGYRKSRMMPDWVPASPTDRLWIPMNAAAAHILSKSAASRHQVRGVGG